MAAFRSGPEWWNSHGSLIGIEMGMVLSEHMTEILKGSEDPFPVLLLTSKFIMKNMNIQIFQLFFMINRHRNYCYWFVVETMINNSLDWESDNILIIFSINQWKVDNRSINGRLIHWLINQFIDQSNNKLTGQPIEWPTDQYQSINQSIYQPTNLSNQSVVLGPWSECFKFFQTFWDFGIRRSSLFVSLPLVNFTGEKCTAWKIS